MKKWQVKKKLKETMQSLPAVTQCRESG